MTQGEIGLMHVVRSPSGKIHISPDGESTVCGADVQRMGIVAQTADWPSLVNCYNCAYRHTPPGYMPPRNGKDFPLRREGATQPWETAPPQNWPCPNGCTDPRDHPALHRYTKCTVFPPKRESCDEGCQSKERVLARANPRLRLDLADSAMTTCYHCGGDVCVLCQQTPVEGRLVMCVACESWE